jgi:hypothetical protein
MNQIENIMQLADLYSVLFGRYRIELSALSLSEHQKARMALRDAIEQALTPGEPYGWVSQHTVKGPYEWQFSKELAGIYPDTAISILPVYTAPQPHIKPEK